MDSVSLLFPCSVAACATYMYKVHLQCIGRKSPRKLTGLRARSDCANSAGTLDEEIHSTREVRLDIVADQEELRGLEQVGEPLGGERVELRALGSVQILLRIARQRAALPRLRRDKRDNGRQQKTRRL